MTTKTLDDQMLDVARSIFAAGEEYLDGNDAECRARLNLAIQRLREIESQVRR